MSESKELATLRAEVERLTRELDEALDKAERTLRMGRQVYKRLMARVAELEAERIDTSPAPAESAEANGAGPCPECRKEGAK